MINIKVNELQQATSNDIKYLVVEIGNLKITDPPKSGGGMKIVNHETSDTTFALKPNEKHIWGDITKLELTLTPPQDDSIVNEYVFQFNCINPVINLILPASVLFLDNYRPDFQAGTTYIRSIIDNKLVLSNFENPNYL